MKSDESRQAMVKRVQATFAKHPTFASLPMLGQRGNLRVYQMPIPAFVAALPANVEYPVDEMLYVTALHAASMHGTVKGRGSGKERYCLFWEKAA